jgi:4'-phosphopantetheinyl transferase
VQVWPLRLTATESVTRRFAAILTPDESQRAARFHFEHLRTSFILSHGALRIFLGRQLGLEPQQVRFRYGTKGKPDIDPPQPITFNMSHSGEIALYAFTLDCDIGVDVERIRPVKDLAAIANRFFCPAEAAELMSLDPENREKSFFLCWTRKESFIKALGEGLSVPLDSFRVTLLPGVPAQLTYIRHENAASKKWFLHNLEFLPDYAAAVAYCDTPRAISLFQPLTPGDLIEMQ